MFFKDFVSEQYLLIPNSMPPEYVYYFDQYHLLKDMLCVLK